MELGIFLKIGDSWNFNSNEIVRSSPFTPLPKKALKSQEVASFLLLPVDRVASPIGHGVHRDCDRSMEFPFTSKNSCRWDWWLGNVWRICWRLVGLVLIWICELKTISTFQNSHPRSKTSRPSYSFSKKEWAKRKEILPKPSVVWWYNYNQRRSYPHAPLQPLVSWMYSFLFPKTPPTNICSKLVERTNAPTLP